MHARDDTNGGYRTYPFDSFDWPPSLLRALDTRFGTLERRVADAPSPRAVRLRSPEGRDLKLELGLGDPVLYVLVRSSGEARWEDADALPMRSGSWLRVWRGPAGGLAPRDVAHLREAGLHPLRDGVCFPDKHLASMRWEDVTSSDLHTLVEAIGWSAHILEEGGHRVA